MKLDLTRTMGGGLIGTVVISLIMYFVAPLLIGAPMDVAARLGRLLGGSWMAGMALHFVIGSIIFPLVYALLLYEVLPGTPVARGALFGVLLWFLSQTIVTPMMGGGLFSANMGGAMAALGSLLGHLAYGGTLGWIAGRPIPIPARI